MKEKCSELAKDGKTCLSVKDENINSTCMYALNIINVKPWCFTDKVDKSGIIHISYSNILEGWVSSSSCDDPEDSDECSVGRIAPWGGHYIAVIHDDVPEDEREEVADFIAAAPEKIKKLQEELEATNTLLDDLWVMNDANEMRNKIRAFSKKDLGN